MANITRFDPFRELARFDPFGDNHDWFRHFSLHPFSQEVLDIGPQIKMDVREADGKYMLTAEIPGVNKDDIHVSVDGNMVSISAEVKNEKEEKKGEQLIRSERSYGMAKRSFSLGAEIDSAQVQAKYNNGVLELTLPKKTGSSQRKEIPIS